MLKPADDKKELPKNERGREKTLWREREGESSLCMHCMYTRSLSSDGEKQPCHCSTEKQPRTEGEDC